MLVPNVIWALWAITDRFFTIDYLRLIFLCYVTAFISVPIASRRHVRFGLIGLSQ